MMTTKSQRYQTYNLDGDDSQLDSSSLESDEYEVTPGGRPIRNTKKNREDSDSNYSVSEGSMSEGSSYVTPTESKSYFSPKEGTARVEGK